MDQNPITAKGTVESYSTRNMPSQLFGGNFKTDNLDKRVQELMRESTEYHELKSHIITKGITRIKAEGLMGRYGSAIPAFFAVVLSYFIDVSYVPFLVKLQKTPLNGYSRVQHYLNKGLHLFHCGGFPYSFSESSCYVRSCHIGNF